MMCIRSIMLVLMMILTTAVAHATDGVRGSLVPAGAAPTGSQEVTVGFYPVTVYNLSLASNTYYLDGYIWFRWNGDIDPTTTLEFTNAVQKWDIVKDKLYDEPQVLKDGSKYQILHLDGCFFQTFSLADFPLDQHFLEIRIEDSNNGVDVLHYVVDQKDSGIASTLHVPGWHVRGWQAHAEVHDYGTLFGGDGDDASASTYSALRFGIEIARPASFLVWKLLLPLTIVLGAAWIALLLEPSLIEVRTGMPATSLLTTVFLQQSYSANLPEVGYLIMLDKIYAVAYVLIVLTLVRIILVGRIDENDPRVADIHRRDRWLAASQAMLFGIAAAVIIAWH